MEIYIVNNFYGSRTENDIIGVFVSKEKATRRVEDSIAEEKELSKIYGSKSKWKKPYNYNPDTRVYKEEDDEETYEIVTHTLIE